MVVHLQRGKMEDGSVVEEDGLEAVSVVEERSSSVRILHSYNNTVVHLQRGKMVVGSVVVEEDG